MSLKGNLGFYNTSSTRTHVRFQFSTHDSTGANVAPSSAFEAADIRIYRAADGAAFSATERASSSGITMTSPFDTLTGVHDVDIDLTDNTDAGFYASGYFYSVVLSPDETIDGQTITGIILAEFEIGVNPVNVTQIVGSATPATNLSASTSQIVIGTVDTVVNGHTPTPTEFQADDITTAAADHYNGRVIIFSSGTLAKQATRILDYTNVGGIGQFTVVAMTTAPGDGDTFVIL